MTEGHMNSRMRRISVQAVAVVA
ncbi:MAG: hypothetical protein H6R02_2806, partial [Burkholderiaceae bacterium]|nr:hypothetical protein [Burkholderiaceae bacterium]